MGVETDRHKLFPIHKPLLGIYNNVPGTDLNPQALVNASNMQVEKGVLAQRFGYPAYGTNTSLVGTPYLFFSFTISFLSILYATPSTSLNDISPLIALISSRVE